MKNKVRTSEEVAAIAASILSSGVERLHVAELLDTAVSDLEHKLLIDELARKLAGSALANRRA